MLNFVEELRWRGMLHDIMPETEELLNKGMVKGYIGFDPTADSLGIGNMVQVMTLLHFQRCGHKPIALVGGATGMVGDPSGKSVERNMLSEEQLNYNLSCQKKQLRPDVQHGLLQRFRTNPLPAMSLSAHHFKTGQQKAPLRNRLQLHC